MNVGKDSLYSTAIKSTKITVVLYVIIKQIYFIVMFGGEYFLVRTIANIVLLAVVFGVTRCGKAIKRHTSWLIPVLLAYTEIGAALTYDGDQTIYIFLAGCALLSLLYAERGNASAGGLASELASQPVNVLPCRSSASCFA